MAIQSKVEILNANDSELSAAFYDKLGREALQKQASDQNRDDDFEVIFDFVSPKDKVLELGCGYGRVLLPLLKKGIDVYGLDISPTLLKSAKKILTAHQLETTLVIACMSATGFENEYFDKIYSVWASFNHILKREKQIQVLNEIYRILKPGGKVFIEMVDGDTKPVEEMLASHGFGPQKRLITAKINKDDNLRTTVFMQSKATLTDISEQSKFENFSVSFRFLADASKVILELHKAM